MFYSAIQHFTAFVVTVIYGSWAQSADTEWLFWPLHACSFTYLHTHSTSSKSFANLYRTKIHTCVHITSLLWRGGGGFMACAYGSAPGPIWSHRSLSPQMEAGGVKRSPAANSAPQRRRYRDAGDVAHPCKWMGGGIHLTVLWWWRIEQRLFSCLTGENTKLASAELKKTLKFNLWRSGSHLEVETIISREAIKKPNVRFWMIS